jgi:hypothetical protein
MRKIVLPEFQDYLRSKSLVKEKYIPFYAHWASKFLSFSDSSKHPGHDLRIEAFLNHLRSQDNIAGKYQKRNGIEDIEINLKFEYCVPDPELHYLQKAIFAFAVFVNGIID